MKHPKIVIHTILGAKTIHPSCKTLRSFAEWQGGTIYFGEVICYLGRQLNGIHDSSTDNRFQGTENKGRNMMVFLYMSQQSCCFFTFQIFFFLLLLLLLSQLLVLSLLLSSSSSSSSSSSLLHQYYYLSSLCFDQGHICV